MKIQGKYNLGLLSNSIIIFTVDSAKSMGTWYIGLIENDALSKMCYLSVRAFRWCFASDKDTDKSGKRYLNT